MKLEVNALSPDIILLQPHSQITADGARDSSKLTFPLYGQDDFAGFDNVLTLLSLNQSTQGF